MASAGTRIAVQDEMLAACESKPVHDGPVHVVSRPPLETKCTRGRRFAHEFTDLIEIERV